MSTVFGGGATAAAAAQDVLEALTATVAHLLERGEAPPAAAREGARTEQINVRLSVQEKLALEASAKHQGFQGLSDFVRAAAVERAR